jgi:serine/threonine-protein kinase
MGAVYEVVHLDTQRRRALKVMLPHVLQNDEMRERFKREALIAADVESEFIVDVFDAGVDDETQMPFLVMELLRGEELGRRLKLTGRLEPAEAVTFLHQAALALDRMHKRSLVHRDLKPENIFLAEREDGPPRVKLLDFGLAKVLAEGTAAAGTTEALGTPSYMAPEQFRPGARITPATDVYAFGLTAYTLLVGAMYWNDEARSGNAFTSALAAAHGPVEPATARAARQGVGLPPAFDAWFATMTAVDPAQRYVSATAAVRALAPIFGLGVPATSIEGPRPATEPSSAARTPPTGARGVSI